MAGEWTEAVMEMILADGPLLRKRIAYLTRPVMAVTTTNRDLQLQIFVAAGCTFVAANTDSQPAMLIVSTASCLSSVS